MTSIISNIWGAGAKKRSTFKPEDLPSQQGKTFIVTGGHAGIGLATTRYLLRANARVIIASRTQSKVDDAKAELIKENASFENLLGFVKLDLNDLNQVKAAAEEILSKEEKLHGIVNNAGIMAVPYKLTSSGIEQQFQVNHLGHWLFTMKLLPLLEKTGKSEGHPARIVNLSSFAHNFISYFPAKPDFTSLEKVNRKFEPTGWIRYSQSKLSNILFSRELNKRCSEHVRSIPVHPGFVASDLYKSTGLRIFLKLFIPVEQGAWSSVYAVASPEAETRNRWGEYLVPHAKTIPTTKYGNDTKLASDLWNLSEALAKEKVGGI